jgi:hypothetical protein
VLYLALEENPRDVGRRFVEFGRQPGDPIWVQYRPLSNSARTLQDIRTHIDALDIKLIIIDTLSRFWRVRDENSNAEIGRELAPILDLAHESTAAVLLIHQQRKSGGEEGRGIRGGSDLFAKVDQALELDRRRGGGRNDRVLRPIGRYSESPRALSFTLDGRAYKAIGTSDDLDPEAVDQRVLTALTSGPHTIQDLQEELKLSNKMIGDSLLRLQEASEVTRRRLGTGKGNPFVFSLRPGDEAQETAP